MYRQFREAILDGRLKAGETLPPSRELARRLAVSRNTVGVAYDRLIGEGFIETRVGAGTYVCEHRGAPAHPWAAADQPGTTSASPLERPFPAMERGRAAPGQRHHDVLLPRGRARRDAVSLRGLAAVRLPGTAALGHGHRDLR
ncbi:MAG: GntR family transcriptional regulator [Streptosporangiaceae bacterium]